MLKFNSENVFCNYDESGLLVIAFSSEKGTPFYFLIQDAYDRNDPQEIELGQDTYYIEFNSQTQSCYGGIQNIELQKGSLKIYLTEAGRKKLQLEEGKLTIEFDELKSQELKEKMNSIFKFEDEVKTKYF